MAFYKLIQMNTDNKCPFIFIVTFLLIYSPLLIFKLWVFSSIFLKFVSLLFLVLSPHSHHFLFLHITEFLLHVCHLSFRFSPNFPPLFAVHVTPMFVHLLYNFSFCLFLIVLFIVALLYFVYFFSFSLSSNFSPFSCISCSLNLPSFSPFLLHLLNLHFLLRFPFFFLLPRTSLVLLSFFLSRYLKYFQFIFNYVSFFAFLFSFSSTLHLVLNSTPFSLH